MTVTPLVNAGSGSFLDAICRTGDPAGAPVSVFALRAPDGGLDHDSPGADQDHFSGLLLSVVRGDVSAGGDDDVRAGYSWDPRHTAAKRTWERDTFTARSKFPDEHATSERRENPMTETIMSRDILLTEIDPDPAQPRQHIDPVKLAELAQSIHEKGLIVPLLVRPDGGRFIIVHGERRYKACQSLGLETIRAEVRAVSAEEAHWLALIENIQRDDLSPLEEARAYQQRLEEGITQTDLAQRIGKTQSYIAQKLRLLKLPEGIQRDLSRPGFSEGHARQLLRVNHLSEFQSYLAQGVLGGDVPVSGLQKHISRILDHLTMIDLIKKKDFHAADEILLRHLPFSYDGSNDGDDDRPLSEKFLVAAEAYVHVFREKFNTPHVEKELGACSQLAWTWMSAMQCSEPPIGRHTLSMRYALGLYESTLYDNLKKEPGVMLWNPLFLWRKNELR